MAWKPATPNLITWGTVLALAVTVLVFVPASLFHGARWRLSDDTTGSPIASTSRCTEVEADPRVLDQASGVFARLEVEAIDDGCAAYTVDEISNLYLTFLRGSLLGRSVRIGPVTTSSGVAVDMDDIALSPAGVLYGVDSTSSLYTIDIESGRAKLIGSVGGAVNGLAVSDSGTMVASGSDALYTVDPHSGAGTLAENTSQFPSAGDVAFSGTGTLYMTSTSDELVRFGNVKSEGVAVGPIGFLDVYGLGFSLGTLYGETYESQLITIDPATGKGTLLDSGDGISANGMAVAPQVASAASANVPAGSTLATPREAFSSPAMSIENALIAVGVVVFVTFPAQMFNATLDENWAEIVAAWRRLVWRVWRKRHRPKPGPVSAPSEVKRRELVTFSAVVVVGSLVGGFRDPRFGFNASSVENFLGTVLALLVLIAVPVSAAVVYRWIRRKPTHFRFRTVPAGIAVAVASVLISRLTHFQPGYLYGLVLGVAFAHRLAKEQEAHVVTLESIGTLSVAVLAWIAFVPVDAIALRPGSGFGAGLLDDLLASIFVGGLVGVAIGMLPLRFLPGGTLFEWRRSIWAVMFGVATFGIVAVMLRPSSGPAEPGAAPLVTTIVLFAVFGGVSVGFRQYFSRRKGRRDDASRVTAPTGVGRVR